MGEWGRDLRIAGRVLLRSRGFAAVAIASLAIGIGANSAVFSVADALLLTPLPYADADRLAIVWQRSPGLNVPQDWLSTGQYLDIKADGEVFDDVAAAIGVSVNLTAAGAPERVDGARVSSSFFTVFGAAAAMGRVFTAEEDRPGAPPAVILTQGFWRRHFGADPAVLGRTLTLNGSPYTIVGVMPAGFSLDKEVMPPVNGIARVDFLLPLPLDAGARAVRGREDYDVFAKLKRGVSLARAQEEMDLVASRMKRDYPAVYPPNGGLTLSVVPLLAQVVGDARLALLVLLGAAGFVLLIACGNVANLLLSRAAIREKELAVRVALGAGRAQLLRQLMAESTLLALAGGALGLLLAVAGVAALRHAGPAGIPRLGAVGVDLRVVGFTFAVALATALLVGLLPALRASRVDPNTALKEGGRGAVATGAFGLGHDRLRRLLIASEVALSLVLCVGAGLLVRSYQRILVARPGFDPHDLLSLRLSVPAYRYGSPEAVARFYRTLEDRVRALPGVASVGANYMLPLSPVSLAWEPIAIEGYVPRSAGDDLVIASSGYVNADYFRAMGIPLLSGRCFTRQDTRDAPAVAIVDRQMAARFWPGQDPLGKRLRRGGDGPWYTVVGVVADEKEYLAGNEPPIHVYFTLEQLVVGTRYLVVRSTVPPAALAASVVREVRALDPDLPVFDVATMEERLHQSLAGRRFATTLLGVSAALALALAGIGIYGVASYWAAQRTREIGIRMAMGASGPAIQRLVLRQAAAPVVAGAAVGLLLAFALARLLSRFLYGVGAADPATFAAVPLLLAGLAVLASYLPARRAARVDPMAAVRQE
jgi:predicted permease